MSTFTLQEYPVSWRITEGQRRRIFEAFSSIATSPYANPGRFLTETLSQAEAVGFFKEAILNYITHGSLDNQPAFYIKGLPVEDDLPVFSNADPLSEKYAKKKTFVTEAVLAAAAFYTNTEIVAFSSINNGDLFHDIYMKDSLKNTASQKSMVSFGFHYDMGFKSDRPDWANLACLRSSASNRVSTSVCRNLDLIDRLSAEDLKILSQPIFITPEEVVSLRAGEHAPDSPRIAVYYPTTPWKFKFFEGRTASEVSEAQAVLERLYRLCHSYKMELVLMPGDLALISNNHCAHCREVTQVADIEAHKKRWLIKTYNRNTHGGPLKRGQFHASPQ
ncbi:Clavaminate synthase 2 [compost metagenome]